MFTQALWWSSMALEVLLLIRGVRGKLAPRYPIFYSYILFVLLQDLLRFSVYRWYAQLYSPIYWTTEFLAITIGCALVFEIYRAGLSAYPGTARMARWALVFVFALACLKAFVNVSSAPGWWHLASVWELELNLRAVQALALVTLVVLFLVYSIRFGKNLNGILLGYSLFVGICVIRLRFVSPVGTRYGDFWSYLHPISYDLALTVWLGYLWAYQACPEPNERHLEQKYQQIAASTQRRLRETREYLRKTVRS